MSRPLYETSEDREAEHELAIQVARTWGRRALMLPRKFPVDVAFESKGRIVSLAEIKIRTNKASAYDTYMISAHKWSTMIEFSRNLVKTVNLIVKWGCGTVGYLTITGAEFHLGIGGRSDRNDSDDTELVAQIPIKQFNRIKIPE